VNYLELIQLQAEQVFGGLPLPRVLVVRSVPTWWPFPNWLFTKAGPAVGADLT
jgi:hypothetical protein